MNPHLQRAMLLLQQSRPEMAERELQQFLIQDPNHSRGHALLAHCLSDQNRHDEATEHAQQAIHLAPDDAYPHLALAYVYYDRNRYPEAEAAVRQSLSLDPYNSDAFALLSQVCFAQRRWQESLQAAEEGLKFDPEHNACTNLRAMALVKLGRKDQAGETIEAALRRDPENALTQANLGWTMLEQGRTKEAQQHFREALRINPELEFARQGMVETLKSRHLIYRVMLAYFLWMGKLSRGAQWAIILGGVIGHRILRSMADTNPALRPWITPLIIAYICFVVMTWISGPLFNFLLRLHRDGRLLLSREETITSNMVGGSLLIGVLLAIAALLFQAPILILGAIACLLTVPALASIYHCDKDWPRILMVVIAVLIVGMALGVIALSVTSVFASKAPISQDEDITWSEAFATLGNLLFFLTVVGAFISQLAANALTSVTARK